MIAIDASVLAPALGADGRRARLREEELVAPEVVNMEAASILRRQARAGEIG